MARANPAAGGTASGAAGGTADSTAGGTAEGATGGSAEGATGGAADGTADGTAGGASEGAADGAACGAVAGGTRRQKAHARLVSTDSPEKGTWQFKATFSDIRQACTDVGVRPQWRFCCLIHATASAVHSCAVDR